ncbi:MAG: dipeptide ABC transporter ATP-binding protein [Pseudomonadota bacterium]
MAARDRQSPVTENLLEIRNLTVDFHTSQGDVHAVRDISFHLDQGETLAILGESGSGKSVSAAAIMNLIDSPPGFIRAGQALYRGQDLLRMSAAERRDLQGRKIAMIFQDTLAHLNPVYAIGWQISEALKAHGVTGRITRARTLELLDRVGIPSPERRIDDYPHQFSGGQRQRVMIAMALALKPDILIADEPTTALDVTTQAEILKLFKELQSARGAAALFITHDMGVVAEIADKVAVMREGRIVETSTRDDVLTRPQHAYTRQLLEAAALRAPRQAATAGKPLVEAINVTRTYRRRTGPFSYDAFSAVRDASLTLRPGQTLGVVGESGSGKSTLARCLLRLEPIDGGRVLFEGQDMTARSDRELRTLRQRMQVVLQDPWSALDPRQKVGNAIAEGLIIHGTPRPEALQKVAALLDMVGLSAQAAERYPHEFSGGQRQRICIARALALEPDVLIADEPVSSLDVSIQAQLIDLFTELQRTIGFALMFITHDLRLAAAICDEIIVMRAGVIVEQGPPSDVLGNPQEPYTQELVAAAPGGLKLEVAA